MALSCGGIRGRFGFGGIGLYGTMLSGPAAGVILKVEFIAKRMSVFCSRCNPGREIMVAFYSQHSELYCSLLEIDACSKGGVPICFWPVSDPFHLASPYIGPSTFRSQG